MQFELCVWTMPYFLHHGALPSSKPAEVMQPPGELGYSNPCNNLITNSFRGFNKCLYFHFFLLVHLSVIFVWLHPEEKIKILNCQIPVQHLQSECM